ncbi:hypothetical protein GW764_02270 [Candidatus Parcubacteria bacterium]|nr:hypothetical protein [Candidatus Parcubacteria bacterium]
MTNKILPSVLVVVLIGTLVWMTNDRQTVSNEIATESNNIEMTVYKSPYCGCCGKWSSYMEEFGYSVENINVQDLSTVKEEHGVPYELESCHTTIVDGYVVEGHIPNEAVQKLLSEEPDIKGIGMAGMPSGSPGMPGPKEDFLIYEINHDGTKGDMFMRL